MRAVLLAAVLVMAVHASAGAVGDCDRAAVAIPYITCIPNLRLGVQGAGVAGGALDALLSRKLPSDIGYYPPPPPAYTGPETYQREAAQAGPSTSQPDATR